MGAAAPGSVFDKSMFADGMVFYDLNRGAPVRVRVAWFHQTRGNDVGYQDYREQLSIFYIF